MAIAHENEEKTTVAHEARPICPVGVTGIGRPAEIAAAVEGRLLEWWLHPHVSSASSTPGFFASSA
jgi:hypothetical protein